MRYALLSVNEHSRLFVLCATVHVQSLPGESIDGRIVHWRKSGLKLSLFCTHYEPVGNSTEKQTRLQRTNFNLESKAAATAAVRGKRSDWSLRSVLQSTWVRSPDSFRFRNATKAKECFERR